MKAYILSILGIVVTSVFIDIIIPSGTISKYIKSIFSIFVVAILLNPLIKFLNQKQDFTIKYEEYIVDDKLLSYIHKAKTSATEKNIEKSLDEDGFDNVDIILNFSLENNVLTYKSCVVNLKNLVILADKQHINKYEFIKGFVREQTGLTDEEIIINE